MNLPKPKLFKYYMRKDVRGYLSGIGNFDPLNDVIPKEEEEKEREKGKTRLFHYTKQQAKKK
jgi:hypothetical protein